ncbi:MAG TPA: 2-phospho-L-lactate transferase [Candidatus Sulfotelmatobacter sp.]|nr:2-phospho-L-lactate transferase [Candidatus Sulfotelmatobacter sp.]
MILALAGGVGGAKLANGLARILPPGELTVAVNTGDDFEHLGLHVSPDLDTVMYTLAGLNNPETGWGRAGETWQFMKALGALGGATWFNLGDLDLATHVERTRRLAAGETLSAITADFCTRLGIRQRVVPMSDQPVGTQVLSDQGWLPFQDYFVRLRCEPRVSAFRFDGVAVARPAVGLVQTLGDAALSAIVICPSNPYVSVDPILAVPGVRAALAQRRVPLVAVSPIVGGQAIKGPALKMMQELGREPSALGVARHYAGLIDGLVIDRQDAALAAPIEALGMRALATDTIMGDPAAQARLAEAVIGFAGGLRSA